MHQLEGFNFGLAHDRWFLGDEQGLGKTKQAIDIAIAKKFQRGYHHCLIICGVNGLKWNWMNEVKIHSNESAFILGQQKNGKIGSNADKLNDAKNLKNHSEYFYADGIHLKEDGPKAYADTVYNAIFDHYLEEYKKEKEGEEKVLHFDMKAIIKTWGD